MPFARQRILDHNHLIVPALTIAPPSEWNQVTTSCWLHGVGVSEPTRTVGTRAAASLLNSSFKKRVIRLV